MTLAHYIKLGLGCVATAGAANLMERVFSSPAILDLVKPDAPIESKAVSALGVFGGMGLVTVASYLLLDEIAEFYRQSHAYPNSKTK